MIDSGRILLDGDVIRYRSAHLGNWDLPVSEVLVIGEATNQNGPADDYFFCFATGPGLWHEASFYAQGRNEFLRELSGRLGSPIEAGLCNSTDFASRVLWPSALTGEPMFQFDDVPAKSLLGKLFGCSENRQTYARRVAAVLASHG